MSSVQRRISLTGFFLLPAVLLHAERAGAQAPVEIPAILMQPGVTIPECLTDPSIWREWIEHRRGKELPAPFRDVARYFKEEGERLGIYWPAVLVQSVHETKFYLYGGRARAENFNVGGVGITLEEGTTTRQNFHTVRNGVRAMLEHVAVYADPHAMGPKIKEQNYRELGVRRFTADRTNQSFTTIAGKLQASRRGLGLDDAGGDETSWRVSDQVDGSPGVVETEPPTGGLQLSGDMNQDARLDLSDAVR